MAQATAPKSVDHAETVEWLAGQPGLLDAYPGEWVALHGHAIVAHHPSFTEAVRLARTKGIDEPLLVPVTAARYSIG